MSDAREVEFEEEWTLVPKQNPVTLLTETRIAPPTNYLRVSKQGFAVEGQYAIDTSLPPPLPYVSRVASDKDSKNLSLYTSKGPITAEIWVIYDHRGKGKRVSLDLCSYNGSVHAKLHDPSVLHRKSRTRPSLDVRLRADNGDISLFLPRCFRGPITILTTHERIEFSPALEGHMAMLTDDSGERVYFVGDQPRSGKGTGNDKGEVLEEALDKLCVIGRHTSVAIRWIGEESKPGVLEACWNGVANFFTGKAY